MFNVNIKKVFHILILCKYKKLGLKVRKYLIAKFMYKKKMEIICKKELKYKKKVKT